MTSEWAKSSKSFLTVELLSVTVIDTIFQTHMSKQTFHLKLKLGANSRSDSNFFVCNSPPVQWTTNGKKDKFESHSSSTMLRRLGCLHCRTALQCPNQHNLGIGDSNMMTRKTYIYCVIAVDAVERYAKCEEGLRVFAHGRI